MNTMTQEPRTSYDKTVEQALLDLGPGMYGPEHSDPEVFPTGINYATLFPQHIKTHTSNRAIRTYQPQRQHLPVHQNTFTKEQMAINANDAHTSQINNVSLSKETTSANPSTRFVYNGTLQDKLIEEGKLQRKEGWKKMIPQSFYNSNPVAEFNVVAQKSQSESGDKRYIIPIKRNSGQLAARINPLGPAMILVDNIETRVPSLWAKYPEYEIYSDKIIATYYVRPNRH